MCIYSKSGVFAEWFLYLIIQKFPGVLIQILFSDGLRDFIFIMLSAWSVFYTQDLEKERQRERPNPIGSH